MGLDFWETAVAIFFWSLMCLLLGPGWVGPHKINYRPTCEGVNLPTFAVDLIQFNFWCEPVRRRLPELLKRVLPVMRIEGNRRSS